MKWPFIKHAPDTGVVDGGAPAEVVDAAPAEPVADAPPEVVGETGDLLGDTGTEPAPKDEPPADWKESLPEEYRDNANVSKYKSMAELLKGYDNAVAMLGKKGIERPGADASDEVKAEFFKRIGRPDAAGDYDWKQAEYPEGDARGDFQIDIDPEVFAGTKQRAHELGLTNEQFQGVMDLYTEDVRGRVGQEQQNEVVRSNEAKVELKNEWGVKYETYLKEAQATINKFGMADELRSLGLGNSAKAMLMFTKLKDMVGEDRIIGDNTGTSGSFEDRIKALKGSDAYKNAGHRDHKKVLQQVTNEYKRRYNG